MECYVAGFVYGVIANYVLIDEVKEQEGGGWRDFLKPKKKRTEEDILDEIKLIISAIVMLNDRLLLQKLKNQFPNKSYTEILLKMGENHNNNRKHLINWYKHWEILGGKFTSVERAKIDKEKKNSHGVSLGNKYIENDQYYTKEFPCKYRSQLIDKIVKLEEEVKQIMSPKSRQFFVSSVETLMVPELNPCHDFTQVKVKCDDFVIDCGNSPGSCKRLEDLECEIIN